MNDIQVQNIVISLLQEVFLVIKRKSQSIFLDLKETAQVLEVKKMIGGIVHKNAEDIKLVYKEKPLDVDNRTLADVGLTAQSTKAQSPALIGLCFKEGGNHLKEFCFFDTLCC